MGRKPFSLTGWRVVLLAPFLTLCLAARGAGSTGAETGPPLRLPSPIVFEDESAPDPVVFDHDSHFSLSGGSCLVCHPSPFSLLHPAHRTDHASMDDGRSCGLCHDGRKAFSTRDSDNCTVCHAGTAPPVAPPADRGVDRVAEPAVRVAPGSVPASGKRSPGRIPLPDSGNSPGSVSFDHDRHASVGLECRACHPKPFAMRAGSTPLPKEEMYAGGTCGACHDGKRAFGVDDPDSCSRCHHEEGAPS